MGTKLISVAKVASRKPPAINVAAEVAKVMDPLKEVLLDTMTDRTSALEGRINKLKSFMIRSTKTLNNKINVESSEFGVAGVFPRGSIATI